jgi:hypothetical protein
MICGIGVRIVGIAGLLLAGVASAALAQQRATVPTSSLITPATVPSGTVAVANREVGTVAPTDAPGAAPFKPAPRGTFIQTTRDARTVHFVNGYDVSYDLGGGRWVGSTALLTDGLSGRVEPLSAAASLWPLEIGKSTSFQVVDAGGGVRAVNARVLRTEIIAVPAGRFFTYVIERQDRGISDGATNVARYWYAPSVGTMVKFDEPIRRSGRPMPPWEMAAIVLPQPLDVPPVAVPGDTADTRAQFCRERGTTLQLPDGRALNVSCLTYVQAELVPYRAWLESRGAVTSVR